jgi:TetR/AcrR family transcriptional regulator, transcriptional repressor for nem operon
MSTPTTKSEILHVASRLLLNQGLNGFSLQELADAIKIKKASLFHHYPSKTALAVELYRFYQEAFLAWIEKYQHLPPEKQIIQYANTLTTWISEKNRVCPVGALSLEWHKVEPELQAEIKKLHELQKKWLLSLLSQMKLNIPKSQAALGLMALLQGSLQLSRLTDDSKLAKKNLRSYLQLVKS